MRTRLPTPIALFGLIVTLGAACSDASPSNRGNDPAGLGGTQGADQPQGGPSELENETPLPSDSPRTDESGTPDNLALGPDGQPIAPALPGEALPEPAPSLAGDIGFSVPSGTFQGALTLTLTTPLEGAEVRYTIDGSVPGPDALLYDGTALSFEDTRQIRAQAYADGVPVGAPGSALYIARTFDVTSDLPLIIVEGYGGGKPIDPEVYLDMAFMVFEPSEGRAALSALPSLATRGGYHVRGQSSASFEQAPYRIELWDNASEDADHPLLGMPAEADWALIGPFVDRSLIRNAFVYGLGRDMGLSAPRFAFAEVYVNAEDRALQPGDYQGIYMLVETIKNHPDRLDLAQLDESDTAPEDVTGGYIFKFDWAASEEPTLACSGADPLGGGGFGAGGFGQPAPVDESATCWTDLEVVDPEPLAPAQAAYLTGYVQQFHDVLHDGSFEQYRELIDLESFVDVFIINELTRNLDAYTRSAFYYKERDQPLTAGPLWDFNLTMGVGFGTNLDVVGWQFEDRNVASDWFRILGVDPAFMAQVSTRWQELRQTLLSQEQLDRRVDDLIAPLAAAAVRDFERWPVSVAAGSFFQIPADPTWEGQVQVIRDWLVERSAWLDSQL
jgi:hypothetical protein